MMKCYLILPEQSYLLVTWILMWTRGPEFSFYWHILQIQLYTATCSCMWRHVTNLNPLLSISQENGHVAFPKILDTNPVPYTNQNTQQKGILQTYSEYITIQATCRRPDLRPDTWSPSSMIKKANKILVGLLQYILFLIYCGIQETRFWVGFTVTSNWPDYPWSWYYKQLQLCSGPLLLGPKWINAMGMV